VRNNSFYTGCHKPYHVDESLFADLLAVGTLGMVQNLVAAGAKRSSTALGIHLRHVNTIAESSVAAVLRKTEQQYPKVGVSLIPVFFPGGMRVAAGEKSFWDDARRSRGSIYEG
jgi:hypothetical protein